MQIHRRGELAELLGEHIKGGVLLDQSEEAVDKLQLLRASVGRVSGIGLVFCNGMLSQKGRRTRSTKQVDK